MGNYLSDFSESNKDISIIKCECGLEIPVIANPGEMGAAIDNHIEEHKKNCKNNVECELVAKRIQNTLFSQLFTIIALKSF